MRPTLIFSCSAAIVGLALVVQMGTERARAARMETECYRLETMDTPIATERSVQRSEVWCYRQLEHPPGATLIFNVDSKGETRPELSMMVERDGSMIHASLKKGALSIHRLKSTFNPLHVPLIPPDGARRIPPPITPQDASQSDEIVKIFSDNQATFESVTIQGPGEFAVSVASEFFPWRGYWFPHGSGRLHYGDNSPMAKFDRYVEGRTGTNPGAQAWEKANHAFNGTKWSGHCNGWAAASILREEPKTSWTDPMTNVTFTVGDQKGLFIERDYCPSYLFFGHRNMEAESAGGGDIDAAEFHHVIAYYIGQLGKPVLMDKMSTSPVENRVVPAYKMKIKEVSAGLYDVETTLQIHEYDLKLTDEVGIAPFEEKTYRYRLQTDPTGHIIKGQWLSANPDFFWVPLAPASCDSRNAGISEHWVSTIGQDLALPGW